MAQAELAADLVEQPHLRSGEVRIAGGQGVAAVLDIDRDLVERRLVHQHIVARQGQRVLVHTAAHRRVALRVEVDQQHPAPRRRERHREVDAGGRLSDAALLVGYRDDLGHGSSRASAGSSAICPAPGSSAMCPAPVRPRCARRRSVRDVPDTRFIRDVPGARPPPAMPPPTIRTGRGRGSAGGFRPVHINRRPSNCCIATPPQGSGPVAGAHQWLPDCDIPPHRNAIGSLVQ